MDRAGALAHYSPKGHRIGPNWQTRHLKFINNVVIVSGVHQTDSIIQISRSILFQIFPPLGCYIIMSRVPCVYSSSLLFQVVNSVAQSCLTLWDPMGCSIPGLPVHHQLPELTQTQVHWVSDAIQPSHPLSSPSPVFNLYQHQGLF